MRDFYRLAVLGDPIAHSKSPSIHQTFLKAAYLDGEYLAILTPADQLEERLKSLREAGYRGVNLTIPLKELSFSAIPSPAVEIIGASNTVIFEEGGSTTTHNTDWIGFVESLPKGLSVRKAAIMGVGGSAKALCYGLKVHYPELEKICLYSRSGASDRQKAFYNTRLAEFISSSLIVHQEFEDPIDAETDLLINATPLGMFGQYARLNPLQPENYQRLRHAHFYDLIYNPAETPFLHEARRRGFSTQNGWDMLCWQAAYAFQLWTGVSLELLASSFAKIPH